MNRLFLAIVSLAIGTWMAHAQFAYAVIDENELQYKVKQIDEFMQRFNHEILPDGSRVTSGDKEEFNAGRRRNLAILFNHDKFAANDSTLTPEAEKFVDYVIDNTLTINYADTTWRAILTCDALHNAKKSTVTLTLRVEKVAEAEYKWVIADAAGKLFDVLPDTVAKPLSISPAEHGIGFFTLPRTIEAEPKAVSTLDYAGHRNDRLSIFNYLVATRTLRLTSVRSVMYRYRVGKYTFDVERIEKPGSYNKGWLINNIQTTDNL